MRRPCERPRIDPQLKRVFKQIGVPEAEPLSPDPFQLEALERVRDNDVLVSAPTGAGKTWIASEAIRRCLARGMRVWYASPLKALSNTIHQQFQAEFGGGLCGILTGDRKENPDAPVIVGTTEILRNQLYDAMHQGTSIRADLVMLDEAHYLSDPDRGVVWEETLIYLPPRVRLLLLSATIPNAAELAAWLERNRGVRAHVVKVDERPVPLEMMFLLPDGLMVPLGGRKGLSGRVKKFMAGSQGKGKGSKTEPAPSYGDVLRCLRELDLLPAIFFLKSRADCDRALAACSRSDPPAAVKERLRAEVTAYLRRYPHLQGHRQMRYLKEALVGAHHAGQLPTWKLMVERMMEKSLLEAIFSTSTVAAGVNFPARTVVLVQSDRFDGRGFSDLTARELHQMIGRAGRRGKDRIGFAVVLPGRHQDPELIRTLRDSAPEPLESRIQINFSMTLNLLLSHDPEEVRLLLDRSFAAFQRGGMDSGLYRRWQELVSAMERELSGGLCDTSDPFEVMEYIETRSELRRRLRKERRRMKAGEEGPAPGPPDLPDSIPCEGCPRFKDCHTPKNRRMRGILKELRSLGGRVEGMSGGLWLSFKRRLRFLKETGFVDRNDRLTPDGEWASRLRLDHPLLIAEAIRKGAFQGITQELMAAVIAPFVWDRGLDAALRPPPGEDLGQVEDRLDKVLDSIHELRVKKTLRRFENPEIMFWPAASLFLWAKGASWDELMTAVAVDEGDMVSLITRTADHLRQVAGLADTHPEPAARAEEAVEAVLREPVTL